LSLRRNRECERWLNDGFCRHAAHHAMSDLSAREEILALMKEQEARPAHVQHVALLALQLFDQLVSLHGLGGQERLWLEAAGHLHDIGRRSAYIGEGHHTESARIIREHPWRNFSPAEAEIIAQVARYHRKSIPELSHEEFRKLGPGDRRIVQCLAAVLRLADSLDRSHLQLVQRVRVELPTNRLVLHVETSGPVLREIRAAQQKGDLAQLVFQRDLVLMIGDEEVKLPLQPVETRAGSDVPRT
jgi:exopolyphosphatase / guanosine-5'-triphosphate,3'-diphosphate pyrophosphatase